MSRTWTEDERAALLALATFGLSVFERHRNDGDPGDVDGGAAELDAIHCGLLHWVPVQYVDGFTEDELRGTELLNKAAAIINEARP